MAQGIGDTTDNPKTQKNPKKKMLRSHMVFVLRFCVFFVVSRPRRRLPPRFSHSPFSFRGLLYDSSS
jgi:hypothetical protein